jgi:N4-gp56 family major capsid protein
MSVAASGSGSAALISGAYPQYAGSGSKFIPEIWSGKLQVKFYKSTVLAEITNNDWEGEIKGSGDKVNIRSIPTITIRDYTKGLNLTNEVPESTPIELTIDKGKYFSVVCDDVDEVQADVRLMDMFTNDAAEQMKIAIDSNVLQTVYADAAAANKGTTAGAISGDINLGTANAALALTKDGASSTTAVLDLILDMGQVLDEQNVPEAGRWMVITPWIASLIKKSDLRQAYLTGDDTSPLRNGMIGQIDRFTLFVSNSLKTVADNAGTTGSGSDDFTGTYVMAGTKDAISFASQITNVETLRAQSTFGNIVRGLNVYGFKVVKPEALVAAYVQRG